jgi:WD40 repeat protein
MASLYLALSVDSSKIVVYNASTNPMTIHGTLIGDGHTEGISDIAFSPDSTKLASGGQIDGSVCLWDLATCEQETVTRIEGYGEEGDDASVYSISFNRAGDKIVANNWDFIYILGVPTLATLFQMTANDSRMLHSRFTVDGTQIISGTFDNERWADGEFVEDAEYVMRVWDSATGAVVKTRRPTRDIITVDPSSDRVISLDFGSFDTFVVWDYETGKDILSVDTAALLGTHLRYVRFGPTGSKIIAGSWNGTTSIWDATDGRLTYTFKPAAGDYNSACFDASETYVILSAESFVAVYDAHSGAHLQSIKAEGMNSDFPAIIDKAIFSPPHNVLL